MKMASNQLDGTESRSPVVFLTSKTSPDRTCVLCRRHSRHGLHRVHRAEVALRSAQAGFVLKQGDYLCDVHFDQTSGELCSWNEANDKGISKHVTKRLFSRTLRKKQPVKQPAKKSKKAMPVPCTIEELSQALSLAYQYINQLSTHESKTNSMTPSEQHEPIVLISPSVSPLDFQSQLMTNHEQLHMWTGARSIGDIDELVASLACCMTEFNRSASMTPTKSVLSLLIHLRSGLPWRHVGSLFDIPPELCCKYSLRVLEVLNSEFVPLHLYIPNRSQMLLHQTSHSRDQSKLCSSC